MPESAVAREVKSQRLNLRTSERQESILRRAASLTDRSVSDFVLESAVDRAEKVLADRRWFTASAEQWEDLQRLLEAPLPSTVKFERLATRTSPFGS